MPLQWSLDTSVSLAASNALSRSVCSAMPCSDFVSSCLSLASVGLSAILRTTRCIWSFADQRSLSSPVYRSCRDSGFDMGAFLEWERAE